MSFQVGDKGDQSISLSIDSATSSDLGLQGAGAGSSSGLVVGGKVAGTTGVEHDDILINGHNWGATNAALTGSDSIDPETGARVTYAYTQATAFGVSKIINSNTGAHGVVASATTTFSGDAGTGVAAAGGVLTLTGQATQAFTLGAVNNMSELVAAINGLDQNITATLNDRGGMDYVDTLGRTATFSGTMTTGVTGLAALANTGHVALSSVDGSSDIVISGASTVDDSVAPNVNTLTAGVGERVSAAAALGLNFGTYSYTGATTVTTGQLGQTLLTGTDTITVNGVKIGNTPETAASTTVTAADIAGAFNAVSEKSGVTAQARNFVTVQMQMNSEDAILSTDSDDLVINGVTTSMSANMAIATLVSSLNTQHLAANTGLVFARDGVNITITSDAGNDISITDGATAAAIVNVIHHDGDSLMEDGNNSSPAAGEVYSFRGYLELTNNNGDVVIGTSAKTDDGYATAETLAALLGLELSKKSDAVSGGGLDLSSATNASAAIASVDKALNAVNTIRGGLGAISNRLDHTVSNLTQTVENHSAARSRIMDADFATESAALAKAQVLAQASTAMLAQANAAPQLALQLLQ